MDSVVSFLKRVVLRDWSAQELSEFYRVESALLQSGMRISSGRGVSDEGDPWFVFCRPEDDEVIIHFARIGGQYLISAPSYGGNVTGRDFHALVLGLLDRQPDVRPVRQRDNIIWHPSALLVMLVASALLKTGHAAEAAQTRQADATPAETDRSPWRVNLAAAEHTADDIFQQAQQNTAILAAIALVTGLQDGSPVPAMVVSAPEPPPPVHVTQASTLALDPDRDSHTGGAGSLAVTPSSQVAALPSTLADVSAHAHAVAAWEMPVVPTAGGSVLPADQGATAVTAHLTGPDLPALPVAASATTLAEHAGSAYGASGVAASLLSLLGGSEPVLYFDTLPAKFASPLHESVHVTPASLPTVTHADVSQPSAPAVSLPPAPVSHPSSTVGTTSPAEMTTTVSAGGSGSSNPAAVSAPAAAVSSPDLVSVLAIMQNFATQVGPHLAVLVSGNQVVEYDYFAIDHTPASVSAVTYDFADGSHLSLVGLPAELAHAQI
nr:hypothetical protein [uncultured Rhodopila sp.]